MAFKDQREWIDRLDTEGELKRIGTEVDWNRELGAVTRKALDMKGPALMFENIKGYKETRCKKVFTGGLATQGRLALMLRLPKNAPSKQLVEITRKRFREFIKPMLVNQGPVKENILMGEDVNLYDFPVPILHHKDGGRFFNTACAVVTRDLDTGIQNVGMYRGMIVGKNRIAVGGLVSTNHMGRHFSKYKERGMEMPVAVAYGWDPAMNFVASASIPPDVCEYDVMGSIRQEPVALVKCETVDLEIPAWAEIVTEGSISSDPKTFEYEGPFGEYTGYYGGVRALRPVMQVKCITHRDDPVYPTALEGMGPGHPNETGTMFQISGSAIAWNVLESAGVPGVKDVYALPASCSTTVAVQIHKTYLGQAKQVALALWGGAIAMSQAKYVIVVDDDIDIHDLEALEWAIAYRVNACENDIVIVPGTHGQPLDPSTRPEQRDWGRLGTGRWNRVLIDATKNWEFPPQEQYGGEIYPPLAFQLAPEDEELVKRKWKEYGFD